MGKQTTRILVVDDHPVVRAGVRRHCDRRNGFRVVAEAADGLEAVRVAQKVKPEVALVDLSMPVMNGIEATRRILEVSPGTRIIVFSVHRQETLIRAGFEAGASGFMLKEQMLEILDEAIETVTADRAYLAPELSAAVRGAAPDRTPVRPSAPRPHLTPRERQILRAIARGRSTKEIAAGLGVTEKTVSTHRQHIMDKLDLHNAASLTRYFLENRDGAID